MATYHHRPVTTAQLIANQRADAAAMKMLNERKQAQAEQAQRDQEAMWAGIDVGCCVLLDSSVTKDLFGYLYTTSEGELIRLDGIVEKITGGSAVVRVLTVLGGNGRSGKPMVGVRMTLPRHRISGRSEREPMIWDGMKYRSLEAAQLKREGRKRPQNNQKFWEDD